MVLAFRLLLGLAKCFRTANVPSGEVSWTALLPRSEGELPLPTVTAETMSEWWHASDNMAPILQPVFEACTLEARGHVAFQGCKACFPDLVEI